MAEVSLAADDVPGLPGVVELNSLAKAALLGVTKVDVVELARYSAMPR